MKSIKIREMRETRELELTKRHPSKTIASDPNYKTAHDKLKKENEILKLILRHIIGHTIKHSRITLPSMEALLKYHRQPNLIDQVRRKISHHLLVPLRRRR